jgi:hypothetical protein
MMETPHSRVLGAGEQLTTLPLLLLGPTTGLRMQHTILRQRPQQHAARTITSLLCYFQVDSYQVGTWQSPGPRQEQTSCG